MHITKVQLVNYRNFGVANILLKQGINTIIGENGSGKTNLFRAIRLLLDGNMLRTATKLTESDFHRGLEEWRGHWIIISLEFDQVSQDEAIQSLFLHNTGNIDDSLVGKATYNLIFRPKRAIRIRLAELKDGDAAGLSEIRNAITIGDYETLFTGRSEADFTDPEVYARIVGDFDNVIFSDELDYPDIGGKVSGSFSIAKEVSFTYVQALRDVVADFRSNHTNPLLTLLKSKSGEIDEAVFAPITTLVKNLNTAIEILPDVTAIRQDIRNTITDAAGETYSPKSLNIKSDLSDEAEKLFQSLKLYVGEDSDGYEGGIHELSLGGANLIYLTLKLLEFKYQQANETFANFLLIEEPEAHIHTHIQKTLFDRLNYTETQIIYSTHSTHISEVSNVENVNILGRSGGVCEVYQPSTGLTKKQIGNVQRYLDAIRSNLLFAKSVILIEGDAEEILIPILVKKFFGVSLDELGISLINIRSTGFENVAVLFHDLRIRKRCSILTDLDATFFDTTEDAADVPALAEAKRHAIASQASGAARQVRLNALCAGNPWLNVFYAPHTFEVDFVAADNAPEVKRALSEIYTSAQGLATAQAEISSPNIETFGWRALKAASQKGKGWFAIAVGSEVTNRTNIPGYILDAIFAAHGSVSVETWFNVLSYRLRCLERDNQPPSQASAASLRASLAAYKIGTLSFTDITAAFSETCKEDEMIPVLESVL